jgi:hypothetical protein
MVGDADEAQPSIPHKQVQRIPTSLAGSCIIDFPIHIEVTDYLEWKELLEEQDVQFFIIK